MKQARIADLKARLSEYLRARILIVRSTNADPVTEVAFERQRWW